MPMLADIADAVIGVDTHADTHALQIAGANGVPIAERTIANNENGFAEAIAFAEHHAPGTRVFSPSKAHAPMASASRVP
jgi:transposase